jgi:hypothetical protein
LIQGRFRSSFGTLPTVTFDQGVLTAKSAGFHFLEDDGDWRTMAWDLALFLVQPRWREVSMADNPGKINRVTEDYDKGESVEPVPGFHLPPPTCPLAPE